MLLSNPINIFLVNPNIILYHAFFHQGLRTTGKTL